MIVTNYRPLYDKLAVAKSFIKDNMDEEAGVAISNYIGNVYASMICMGDSVGSFDYLSAFRTKRHQRLFVKKIKIYNKKMLRNFVLNKDFHHQYMGEILPTVEDGLCDLIEFPGVALQHISKKEFFEIFYAFLSEYNLVDEFDKLYKNGHIFSTQIGNGVGNLGSTLYNPITRETDMFVTEFDHTFPCMNTLAHEFGHEIDLSRFDKSIADYNNYFFASAYGEVLSRLMERLLLRFCLKNDIFIDQVRDSYIAFEDLNHDYLLESYILSSLDDDFIYNEGFKKCDNDVIVRKARKGFKDEKALKEFIDKIIGFDVFDSLNYSYGDIISLFLLEEVERSGFFNELMEYYFQNRDSLFSEEFLRKCGFGPANYTKLYEKEVELIKK